MHARFFYAIGLGLFIALGTFCAPSVRRVPTILATVEAQDASSQDTSEQGTSEHDTTEQDTSEQDAPQRPEEETSEGEASLERRPVPNYDGREPAPTSPGEKAAWVPRVILYPAYLVAEYVIRQPLGFFVSRAEQVDAVNQVVRFFHFGDRDQYVLYPIFSLQNGFRPTIGARFAAKNEIAEDNKLFASFNIGGFRRGASILSVGLGDRQRIGDWDLALRTSYSRRDDGRFFGVGSENQNDTLARFDFDQINVALEAGYDIQDQGFARLTSGYRYQRFGTDLPDSQTSIPEALDQGIISRLPAGFEDGLSIHYTTLNLVLDSRPKRPASQTGVRLRLRSEADYDVRMPSESAWITYGGALSGFVDVSGVQHILGLTVSAAMIENINGEVPFTELLAPGGTGPLSGFIEGFLLGESEFVTTLEYNWPIWYWLDGTASFAVGNTFDSRFDGFELDRLRMSWGVGIAAVIERDHLFQFELGWGTDTFENGPNVESFRLAIGAHRDF